MKNSMIPQREIELLNEIQERMDEIFFYHENNRPDLSGQTTPLLRIHSVLYLSTLKDFCSNFSQLKSLLEIPSKDFETVLTDGGKMSLESVEAQVLVQMVKDILTK